MNKEELILKIDLILLVVLIICLAMICGAITNQFLNQGLDNKDFWAVTNCSIGGK